MDGAAHGARAPGGSPANARRYVARLEELSGTPFTMISVGARREETIVLSPRCSAAGG